MTIGDEIGKFIRAELVGLTCERFEFEQRTGPTT